MWQSAHWTAYVHILAVGFISGRGLCLWPGAGKLPVAGTMLAGERARHAPFYSSTDAKHSFTFCSFRLSELLFKALTNVKVTTLSIILYNRHFYKLFVYILRICSERVNMSSACIAHNKWVIGRWKVNKIISFSIKALIFKRRLKSSFSKGEKFCYTKSYC